MASTQLLTWQDMTERLLDGPFGQLSRDGRNERLAKRAVIRAMNDFPSMYRWAYYEREKKFSTVASQTTGTITYDHTGGSVERLLTLSGATFPTDAYLYHVIIDQKTYDIAGYVDSTNVQLAPDSNPGEDVAAGTSYTLYKRLFPLPVGARRISNPVNILSSETLEFVSPAQSIQVLCGAYTPQRETCYTLRNAANFYGAMCFELLPPPGTARTYDYVYEAMPKQLVTEKYSTGTATVAAGSTTVSGSGTAWTSNHVGAIIRFSSDSSNEPSAPEGYISVDNPYVAQRTIMSVSATDSLTIDEEVSSTATYSGVKYTISDPIDVEPHSMLSAVERLAICYLAEDLGRYDEKERRRWRMLFDDAYRLARIADNHARDERDALYDRSLFSLRDWLVEEAAGGSVIT